MKSLIFIKILLQMNLFPLNNNPVLSAFCVQAAIGKKQRAMWILHHMVQDDLIIVYVIYLQLLYKQLTQVSNYAHGPIVMHPYNVQQNLDSNLNLLLFSSASHFLYPGNVIGPGNVPLQITQSSVSDIPDSWLQVRGLLN